jgi:hypothetical protein
MARHQVTAGEQAALQARVGRIAGVRSRLFVALVGCAAYAHACTMEFGMDGQDEAVPFEEAVDNFNSPQRLLFNSPQRLLFNSQMKISEPLT